PARHPLARALARAFSADAVQRLAGGGASARPRRLRTFCPAHDRASAARCERVERTRTVAGEPLPRWPVLCRGRPYRTAPRAAGIAPTHHGRRWHAKIQQRTDTG